jgi:hypothetical protein
MKSAGAVACAFLALLFPVYVFGSADARMTADPVRSPENSLEWDFGKVKAGDVVTHEFIFKNGGDKPLKIINVATSCGCTASKIKKDLLAPDESTSLSVSFNSKSYNGAVRQFVYVTTDAIDKSVTRYIIKAEVVK